MYAPQIIILSGGASNATDYFLPQLSDHVTKHLFRYPVSEPVPIVISQMGEYAGVLGAVGLAWDWVDQL